LKTFKESIKEQTVNTKSIGNILLDSATEFLIVIGKLADRNRDVNNI